MDLTNAITLMTKLRAIPSLPEIRIIDAGGVTTTLRTGNILSLKKNLVDPESLMLMQHFIKQYKLSLTETDVFYLIST
jgi:hypothetical protein